MLRALLLGVLSVTAVASCKGKEGGPAVQAGVTAGKVVEVTGTVTAKRGSESRPLAVGSEVSGDDEVTTGADSAVSIVLLHNNATWQLIANKHGKVAESLAWGLAKVDTPAVGSIESTSAAGRHAEKAAANSNTTVAPTTAAPTTAPAAEPAADNKPDPAATPPAQSAAATKRGDIGQSGKGGGGGAADGEQPKSAPMPAPVAPAAQPSGGSVSPGAAPADVAPPPPPPPPPPPAMAAPAATTAPAAKNETAAAPARERSLVAPAADAKKADVADELHVLADRDRDRMKACVDASTTTLSVTLVVSKGTAKFQVPAGTSPAITACLAKIAAGMKPSASAGGQLGIKLK